MLPYICLKVVVYDVTGPTLGAQTLGADHNSHTFSGLIPGHLYRAEVITHSGELTNSAVSLGRTCKTQYLFSITSSITYKWNMLNNVF